MSIPTLYVPLRTGDILWPAATAFPATTHADNGYQHEENHTYPKIDFENQYGSRSANGTRTVWKNIDISSLMQGITEPRVFRIVALERNVLADAGTGQSGDANDNPHINGLYFDTYMSVESMGGSGDKRIDTTYTTGNSTLIGSSFVSGFHTGRMRYLSGSYLEQTSTDLAAGEVREGTFVVNPNFPYISIAVTFDPIYPQDDLLQGFIGPINAIVKITPA